MKKIVQPFIDTILGWTISKKLTVWAVATVVMFLEKDIPDNWLYLSLAYLGIQGWHDIAVAIAKAKGSNNNSYQNYPQDENSSNYPL